MRTLYSTDFFFRLLNLRPQQTQCIIIQWLRNKITSMSLPIGFSSLRFIINAILCPLQCRLINILAIHVSMLPVCGSCDCVDCLVFLCSMFVLCRGETVLISHSSVSVTVLLSQFSFGTENIANQS